MLMKMSGRLLALLSYDTKSMSDEQVKSKVEELLRSALFEQKRSDDMRSDEKKEKATPEQIRSSFDAEIAFLMTFFKMNIDVRNIKLLFMQTSSIRQM